MRIILVALLVMVAQSSLAQTNKRYYIIEGRVTNTTGKAVRGVGIEIDQTGEKFKVDRDGSYFIRIPEGAYLIRFSAEDYSSKEALISLQLNCVVFTFNANNLVERSLTIKTPTHHVVFRSSKT